VDNHFFKKNKASKKAYLIVILRVIHQQKFDLIVLYKDTNKVIHHFLRVIHKLSTTTNLTKKPLF